MYHCFALMDSFLAYHWKPPTDQENETISSQIGDGCIIRKPYRCKKKELKMTFKELFTFVMIIHLILS